MNLTTMSALIKKFGKYLLIVVVSYYSLILVIFPSGRALIKAMFFRETPPTNLYGKLKPLEFSAKSIRNSQPEYVLNTKNGKLPTDFPGKMTVYKFKPQQYSYLAGKNAIADAQVLGFTEEDLITDLKGNVFQWRNSRLGSTLTTEINTREIIQNTNMSGKSMYFSSGEITEESAKLIASGIFKSISRYDDLYDKGVKIVKLGNYVGNKIYEATDIREAQVALVDSYRIIDKYLVLGPDSSKSLLRMIVRKQSREPNPLNTPLVEATYWALDTDDKGTYPIIPVKNAWASVQQGHGVITTVTPKNFNPFDTFSPASIDKILIDNIFLAYYETPKYQAHLQPIYVFKGTYTASGNESGYVTIYFPAITGEWTESSNQQQ